MPLKRRPSDKPPNCAVMEKAFEIAEASLRLEGMTPGPRYYALKERVLAGEITPDQAVAELTNAEHKQDMEIAREVMRDNREALRELGAAESGSKFNRSFAGFPVFPESGRRITTEVVREIEDEMDIEDWQRLNPPK